MTHKDDIKELIIEANELEQEALPPSPALPSEDFPVVASGRILLFLVCFFAVAFTVRFTLIEGPSLFSLIKDLIRQKEVEAVATPSILYDFFIYMSFACQFIPLPTLPPLAFVAKAYHPVVVAAVGALGTCVANLNDYAFVGWLFRHNKVQKIRDVKSYRKFLDFFDRYAFLTLSIGAFLPIPVDIARLLAISRAYSFPKYILAAFVGRFPRYLIIAYVGKELPMKYILLLFALTCIPGIWKFTSDMIKKRRKK